MKISSFFLIAVLLVSCDLMGQGNNKPDIPGKIVFSATDDSGTSQIYTMNADGSDLSQLTHFEKGHDAVQPSWSPDGQQILFSSFKYGTSMGPALWVMNADGSNQQVLYDAEPNNPHVPPLAGNNAEWSPDGTKIVFDLCPNCQVRTNNDIYVFNTLTDSVTQLTEHTGSDTNPSWSPDGQRIVFVSGRDYPEDYAHDLYVLNANGNNITRLTQTGNIREVVWSLNENIVAFRSTGPAPGVYKIDIKTGHIYQIKEDLTKRVQFHPNSWALGGKYLLLTAWELDEPHTNTLYVYDLEGNNLINIYSQTSKNTIAIKGADWFVPN